MTDKDYELRATTIVDPLSGKVDPMLVPGEVIYEPGMIEVLKGNDLKQFKKLGCHFTKNGPLTLIGNKVFECGCRDFNCLDDVYAYIKENPGIVIYELYKSKLNNPNKYRMRYYGVFNSMSKFGPLCMNTFDSWLFEFRRKFKSKIVFTLIQKYFSFKGYDKEPIPSPSYLGPITKDDLEKKQPTTIFDKSRERTILETMKLIERNDKNGK